MAVTLQVARVSPEELVGARMSSAELDRIVSFESRPTTDYLDLDWAYTGLLRLSERAGPAVESAMRRALDGDAVIDSAVDAGLGLYSPVSFLEPADVVEVARVLNSVDLEGVLEALPAASSTAEVLLGHAFEGDVRDYLGQHWRALRIFYGEAADRGLAVMLWCD